MKKFLLTVALILAVVTSLTAGTLASYSRTDEFKQSDVTSKVFKFASTGSQSFNQDFKLIPGDTVWYQVDVKNESEVPVKFTVNSDLNGALSDAVKMSVYKGGKAEANKVTGGTFIEDHVPVTSGNTSFSFYVKLEWPTTYTDSFDVSMSGKSANLSVTVNGSNTEKAQEITEAGAAST